MCHIHTKEFTQPLRLQTQGLSLFCPSTNKLFRFWKTEVLPFCRLVPWFSFTNSSSSHLVTVRIYYIQGSRLSVTDRVSKLSEVGPPTTVMKTHPPIEGGT